MKMEYPNQSISIGTVHLLSIVYSQQIIRIKRVICFFSEVFVRKVLIQAGTKKVDFGPSKEYIYIYMCYW